MPKERKVSPGVSGAIDDAIEAVKSYAGYGKRSVSGSFAEQAAADEEDANTPSNAGRQAQSTDAINKYQ